MPQIVVQVLLGLPALVALLLVAVTLRRERAGWSPTSWFVAGIATLPGLAVALSTLLGYTSADVDATNGSPFENYTLPSYATLTHLQNYLLIIVSVVAVLLAVPLALRRNIAPQRAGLLFLALIVVDGLSDQANGGALITKGRLALALIIIAATVLPPAGAALGAATFGLLFTALSGIAGLVNYASATSECGANKCGPLGVLWQGIGTSENSFGLIAAATIPFVYVAVQSKRIRLAFLLYLVVMVWFTGSRSALVGAIVTVLACLLAGTPLRLRGWRRAVVIVIAASGVAIGLVLPLEETNPLAYTFRGSLWITARTYLRAHLTAGLGDEYWGRLTETGRISITSGYSVHNQWLDVLFDGGIIGLIIFLFVFVGIARRSCGVLLLMPVIFCGITERLVAVGHADTFVWVLPAILLATNKTQSTRSTTTAAGPATSGCTQYNAKQCGVVRNRRGTSRASP